MVKNVQIITNCSCSSCVETSKIKPDYNTLLHSFADDDDVDKSTNDNETPDLLLNPNFNSVKNSSKDGIEANERFLKLFKEFQNNEKLEEINEKALFTKFEEKVDLEKIRELLHKYSKEERDKDKNVEKHHVKQHELVDVPSEEIVKEAEKVEIEKVEKVLEEKSFDKVEKVQEVAVTTEQPVEKVQVEPQHHHHHHHRGPHHSIVLDSDVKEKIDVEPHYLHPAVAGQEISYHDNIVVPEKTKKEEELIWKSWNFASLVWLFCLYEWDAELWENSLSF